MNDKIIELAKKLKALADRGVGGEKENAIEKLERVMQKHGITIDDINGRLKKDFDFHLRKEITFDFVNQVVASVLGSRKEYGHSLSVYKYIQKRGFKSYQIERVEPDLFSEIIIKIDLFWDDYKEQQEIFYEAYIQKNRLYRKPSEKEDEVAEELTPEEREKLFKMSNMMQGIDRVKFQKRLE